MTLKKYLAAMAILAGCGWLIWTVVLFQIDPLTAGWLAVIFFYLTLFFAATASFAVLGLLFRLWLVRADEPRAQMLRALRQGALLAVWLIAILTLVRFYWLTWWLVILLVFFLAVVEFFFLSLKDRSAS